MSMITRAMQALDRSGVCYTVHTYAYDPSADPIGVQLADAVFGDDGESYAGDWVMARSGGALV